MADIETVVIGAGVIGLAVARSLVRRGQEVMVLERHGLIGSETSSRNSEVIHAGLYYPPGSLRARHCVEGRRALYDFAVENGVGHRKCGKLLVATTEDEVTKLDALEAVARRNGVDEITRLSREDVRVLEPEVSCVAAVLSPSTGIIDSHGLMSALDGHVASLGGQVVLNTEVVRLEREPSGEFRLALQSGGAEAHMTCRRLVIAAGHDASRLGRMLSGTSRSAYVPPETYPAKGHYFLLSGRTRFHHLVYPMPSGAWLGIHLTLDLAGAARFGPDLAWTSTVDYAFEDAEARQNVFEREIRRYWPGLPEKSLVPGYTGVRPKIYREGEPAADFAIHGPVEHGQANLVALYGIESPGLTSCLAIAEDVADRLAAG